MGDNDKQVQVRYSATAKPAITFQPNGGDVEMTASGHIMFVKAAGSDAFEFEDVTFIPNDDELKKVETTSRMMLVHDKHSRLGTYQYCMMIQGKDGPEKSDPQIINRP